MFKRKNRSKRKRRLFKHIRPGKWIGASEIRSHAGFLKSFLAISPQDDGAIASPSASKLSFDESLKKHNLTESDLVGIALKSYRLTILFFILSCSLLFYAMILLHRDLLLASFFTISFSLLLLSYSMKECFAYARVKLRKLNVGFRESLYCFFNRGRS
jgi:hypothetical protein